MSTLLLDLDDTCLATREGLKAGFFPFLASATGLSVSEVQALYEQTKRESGFHDVERHFWLLAGAVRAPQLAEELPEKVRTWLRDVVPPLVFPDVRPALCRLRDRGVHVRIFSRGSKLFQTWKLEASGLRPLVDSVQIIEQGSKAPAFLQACCECSGPFVFVDDDPGILAEVYGVRPADVGLRLLLMRRYTDSPLADWADQMVGDLTSIVSLGET